MAAQRLTDWRLAPRLDELRRARPAVQSSAVSARIEHRDELLRRPLFSVGNLPIA